jgi:hypothetical protein
VGANFHFRKMPTRTHFWLSFYHTPYHDQRIRHQRVQRSVCCSVAINLSAWNGGLVWAWILSPGGLERSIEWVLQESILAVHAGSACNCSIH